eukprot:TRINITY_DN9863_c0_g1_i3.p2 TRINITY_DN9863_c0_g1~~TRINITY_DN9863_c0_g1_i3.p2  ORF type:complete len:163 (+),score=42.39 TRINITY_DN9863_c0_g1_i3:1120-1608(+)
MSDESQPQGEPVTAQQLQGQLQQMQSYKQSLENELQMLSDAITQLKLAQNRYLLGKDSLQAIAPENDGKDYLLPITESLFVNSKLDGNSKVVIDLGTGYYVEKSTAKAAEFFDRKIAFVTKRLEELQKVARGKATERSGLDQNIQQILRIFAQLRQQAEDAA